MRRERRNRWYSKGTTMFESMRGVNVYTNTPIGREYWV